MTPEHSLLPDPGAPPPLRPAPLLHYIQTQWRRAFGLNLSRIDELLFVGGQFRPDQWPHIRAMGVRAVLSLQAEHADVFEGAPPERALRLPVEDFHPPSVEQLRAAVAFLRETHAARLPVLVHCHAGVGRASLTASAFLVASTGLSAAEAFGRISHARPIVRLNRIQRARLDEWERLHRQEP